jgi:hypothetical protein
MSACVSMGVNQRYPYFISGVNLPKRGPIELQRSVGTQGDPEVSSMG